MLRDRLSQAARMGWLLAAAGVALVGIVRAEAETATGPRSGLPVPRFVSLKPDRVNVRAGPTRDHEVTFVYTRSGLPVEITAESWHGQATPWTGGCFCLR